MDQIKISLSATIPKDEVIRVITEALKLDPGSESKIIFQFTYQDKNFYTFKCNQPSGFYICGLAAHVLIKKYA